jgi:hypothetical protein
MVAEHLLLKCVADIPVLRRQQPRGGTWLSHQTPGTHAPRNGPFGDLGREGAVEYAPQSGDRYLLPR